VTPDGRPFVVPGDGVAGPATPEVPAPPAPRGGDDGVPDAGAGPLPLEPGGAARALAALRARLGYMPQLTSIGLYDTYAIFTARDRDAPGHVDRYVWRDGAVDDGEPERIARDRVGPAAFRAGEVRLARVPALVARALQVPIELPEVCCVLISRQVPFRRDIMMTASVTGSRESATVLADARGRVVRILR